ncbi:hypothetical protein ACFQ6H_27170 [Rhodococcus sp. NPDC056506]|uniref:hypothetical protein n=1 Tax=Rhodococcus sp. NPDC056506 TaxID=3345844 RepID=UPI00366C7CA0
MTSGNDRPAVPQELADEVLQLPVEVLRWVASIGPRIANLPKDDQDEVLRGMSELADGQDGNRQVNIFLGNKNIAIANSKNVRIKYA